MNYLQILLVTKGHLLIYSFSLPSFLQRLQTLEYFDIRSLANKWSYPAKGGGIDAIEYWQSLHAK